MTNTLPELVASPDDAGARKRIAALTIEGTVLLTRYSLLRFGEGLRS